MYEPSQDTKDVNLSVWTSARLKVEKEYRAAFPEYAKLRRDLRSAMYAGKYSLLKDIYYSAVLLFPDDPDIHRIYFEYYKRNGDIETPGLLYRFPEDVIRKLRELCPDNPEYEAASADLLLRRGDYYKAADAYSKLVVRLPDHLDIAYHYGLVLKYLGDDKMSRQVINGIRNHYQDTQSKLKKGERPLLHSDQGWQYQMTMYQKILADKGIVQSMSRKGNCLDNAVIENFFGTIKSELFYTKKFNSTEELQKEIN